MSTDPSAYEEFEDAGEAVGLPAQLRDPIGVLRRQMRWILAILAMSLAATAVATALFPLSYQVRATILLTEKSIPDNFVPTTIMANIIEQFEAIRGEVFTRDSLSKIITETGLYAAEWDTVPLSSLAARLASEMTVEATTASSRSRIAPRSISFEIKLTGKEREKLASVVNMTISELINANLEYRDRQARTTTEFMQREFDQADALLRSHQRKLAQFRADNRGGGLPEEQGATLSKLERLEDQRRSTILQISDLRARLQRLETQPGGASERENVEALRARLLSARSIYTDDHPNVRSLERQLIEMEQGDSGETQSTSASALSERAEISRNIRLAQARLSQIDQDVLGLEQRLSAAPDVAEQYAAMLREEQVLQENHVNFLRKLNSAELAMSLEQSQQGAQLTRLDEAIVPTSPIIPRWMVGLAGVVVSFGLALVVGIARELLFPVIVDAKHLEEAIPIPCLGSITEISILSR